VPGCFVVWAESFNAEGLGGGVQTEKKRRGRDGEILLFYERMTQSELVINSE